MFVYILVCVCGCNMSDGLCECVTHLSVCVHACMHVCNTTDGV